MEIETCPWLVQETFTLRRFAKDSETNAPQGSALKKCKLHTKATVQAIQDRLSVAKTSLGTVAFEELQTSLGWSIVENGLMSTPALSGVIDVTSQVLYDWMHVLFVSGVFNIHVGAMMVELKSYGISYATLHSYISLWSWPSHVGTNTGADCFGPKKAQTSARKQ
eukprot:6491454-Amphidinium_carterae.3